MQSCKYNGRWLSASRTIANTGALSNGLCSFTLIPLNTSSSPLICRILPVRGYSISTLSPATAARSPSQCAGELHKWNDNGLRVECSSLYSTETPLHFIIRDCNEIAKDARASVVKVLQSSSEKANLSQKRLHATNGFSRGLIIRSVSYTHLTLPTILRV